MAGPAFCRQGPEHHQRFACRHLVTGPARDLGVGAAQGETAVAIVIEFFGQPIDGHVAAGAVGASNLGREAGHGTRVHVAMAAGAHQWFTAEGRGGARRIRRRAMASRTGDQRMPAAQGETGRLVVEGVDPPVGLTVADRTGRRRIGRPAVHVGVAGVAGRCRWREVDTVGAGAIAARRGRLVAKRAGCGPMGSAQRKGRRVVVGESEACRPIAIHGMASFAYRPARTPARRTSVFVPVAVDAARASRSRSPALVTIRAGYLAMAAPQRVSGLVVIKAGALDQPPTSSIVAVAAARTERPRMRVTVTVGTMGVRQPGEDDDLLIYQRFVARPAGYLAVPAGKGIIGRRVIE